MTYREFYTAIANGEMNTELQAFATDAIEKLDTRNANRKARPSKVAEANEPIKAQILEFLANGETHIAKEIGEAVGITTAKASALCGQLAKDNKVVATEKKIPKVGKRIAYTLAQSERVRKYPFSFVIDCLLINKRSRPGAIVKKLTFKKGVDFPFQL